MTHHQQLGLLIVVIAGLCIGIAPLPLKQMRQFKYEQWAFVGMLTGLIVIPWMVTLIACPDALGAFRQVGTGILLKANLFSICWGIANILYLQCMVRIGVSLTSGIVGGMTVALGVVIPLVFKGTGAFQNAPSIDSFAGVVVLVGAAVMLTGVVLASIAGLGRERALSTGPRDGGGFAGGLVMAIFAGFLGSGISFAFVYSQGPILEAMRSRGAGDIPANVSVWAAGLLGGALANVLYPAYLMTKRKSWIVLGENPREALLAAILGTAFITGFSLMGKGMVLLGVLGASVGFGVQQSVQMLGNQVVGFATGEWRGATGSAPKQIYAALAVLVIAIVILSFGNAVAGR
jgi:L-rhamnose-H+ transport protein